eukprot:CAMPEP_0118969738 /NCGR_PEP_ID=MMETSP1173-20130426/6785_1 /TAXON_ID=1034831 /ORGANISM="Rhizochromulina marina cf, Strain CCMP1243" /LENGTH=103 /DNA_ID=CAMNT_0006919015 /DNA_START=452 /DNA_END=760 /DNA_ORIENTATION=+
MTYPATTRFAAKIALKPPYMSPLGLPACTARYLTRKKVRMGKVNMNPVVAINFRTTTWFSRADSVEKSVLGRPDMAHPTDRPCALACGRAKRSRPAQGFPDAG